jgi:hypothetical protein
MDKELSMSNDQPNNHRLPRRELMRIAGLTVAAAGVAGGVPLSALAASAQDETSEGFLAYAYAQRAQAMTTGNTDLLDALYDPASTAWLSFERIGKDNYDERYLLHGPSPDLVPGPGRRPSWAGQGPRSQRYLERGGLPSWYSISGQRRGECHRSACERGRVVGQRLAPSKHVGVDWQKGCR